MKQVFMNSKGEIQLCEVDEFPVNPKEGHVYVKNNFSVISSGTDRSQILGSGGGSLVGKIQSNPTNVIKTLDILRQNGFSETVKKLKRKLGEYTPLGYSSSGTIISIGKGVKEYSVGEMVCCAGVGFANHAEIIEVPTNLLSRVGKEEVLDQAAYSALFAIVFQGIKNSGHTIGDNVVVVGLGLLGQLALQISRLAGLNVYGVDLDKERVEFSKTLGFDCLNVDEVSDPREFKNITRHGFDGAIITASSPSQSAFNFATDITRLNGVITLIGIVGLPEDSSSIIGKNLKLNASRSYGPGRYDKRFEERGLIFPYEHVRWTQKGYFDLFTKLLDSGQVNLRSLISKKVKFSDSLKAYEELQANKSLDFSYLLEYDDCQSSSSKDFKFSTKTSKNKPIVGFWGLGNHSKDVLLPNILRLIPKENIIIGSSSPQNAQSLSSQFDLVNSTTDFEKLTSNLTHLFISSKHNEHYGQILQALRKNINIYVEKPMVIKKEHLKDLEKKVSEKQTRLMVGHNRKFSKYSKYAKNFLQNRKEKVYALARISSPDLNEDHWMLDEEVGGGMIMSELSHYLDTLIFIIGEFPERKEIKYVQDSILIDLHFKNGSLAQLSYLFNSSNKISKELYEFHIQRNSLIIDNFQSLKVNGDKVYSDEIPDKGFKESIQDFLNAKDTDNLTNNKFDMQITDLLFDILEEGS